MLKPTSTEVFFNVEDLRASGQNQRQDFLAGLLDGYLALDSRAGDTADRIGRVLMNEGSGSNYQYPVSPSITDLSHGKFSAGTSLSLTQQVPRIRGFVNAIRRWDKSEEGILDVGTGAFPIMALAAAQFHPKAEVTAVEIDGVAAEVASDIVSLFGLQDRITVINEDVANFAIDPNTSAAVTETFHGGLVMEPGPKIVRMLAESGVEMITPSFASVKLNIAGKQMQKSVDLTQDVFVELQTGRLNIPAGKIVRAGISYSLADRNGMVLDFFEDDITLPYEIEINPSIGAVLGSNDGIPYISYELGARQLVPRVGFIESQQQAA